LSDTFYSFYSVHSTSAVQCKVKVKVRL